MRKFFILSLLSFSTFGGVAHADWKQTKWGMTVAQVQAKCPNAVAVSSDSETQRQYNVYNGDKTLLREENYKVGDMNYDVRFIFDENNRLKAINMVGDQYYYIRTFDLLSGKYGKPAVYSGNGGQLSSATWQVPDKHLVIKLLEIMSTQIRYEPMTDAL